MLPALARVPDRLTLLFRAFVTATPGPGPGQGPGGGRARDLADGIWTGTETVTTSKVDSTHYHMIPCLSPSLTAAPHTLSLLRDQGLHRLRARVASAHE